MRTVTLLALLIAAPLDAWEFTASPVCTLSQETGDTATRVTYDPRLAEPYAIEVTRDAPWPDAPVFAMRFEGPRGLTISTTRHRRSADGGTVTVSDTGFGNVLNGLEFNRTATALLGDSAVDIPLAGAAEPVRAFRACTEPGVALTAPQVRTPA